MLGLGGETVNLLDAGGWGAFVIASWTMVAYVLRKFGSGKWRTDREVEEIRKDRDARLLEANYWKTAYEERGKTVETLLSQNSRLMVLAEVSAKALNALPEVLDPDSGGAT